MDLARGHVLVCGGTGCTSSNSQKIIDEFEKNLAEKGIQDEIKVVRTGCFGLCALGPIVIVYPEGAFYTLVKPEDVSEIVEEHLLKGRIVKRLLYQETVVDDESATAKQMGKMKQLSPKSLKENNPHKVHISITGKITEI